MWLVLALLSAALALLAREETLFSIFVELGTAEACQDAVVPLESYWGETVQLRLEVAAGQNSLHEHGCRAVSRLVVDGGERRW